MKPANNQRRRNYHQTPLAHRQRQLPPLQDVRFDDSIPPESKISLQMQIIKQESEQDRKAKFEEDWELDSRSPTPVASSSPEQSIGTSMPGLSQTFDDLSFYTTHDNMLSQPNAWGSTGQYPGGYASSSSSSQSYYGRPTLATGRSQQNLPSLTEINLTRSTPSYSSRSQLPRQQPNGYYSSPSDALDIAYNKTPQTSYAPSFTHTQYSTPRTTYPLNTTSGLATSYTTLDQWSPVDPYCTYPNGHSWPPSMACQTGGNYVSSDTSSMGTRRRRGNLPKHVTDILRAWFQEHLDHPYPTDEDKQMLIGKTHLTISQVSHTRRK